MIFIIQLFIVFRSYTLLIFVKNQILRLHFPFHICNALVKSNSDKFFSSKPTIIKKCNVSVFKEFRKSVFIKFCFENPRSHSTDENGIEYIIPNNVIIFGKLS